MEKFQKGQRWISEMEPELGIGVVVDVAPAHVFLLFRASGTLRQYAAKIAPIKRVEFRIGDNIQIHTGETHIVDDTKLCDGILTYICGEKEIPETELSDLLSFSNPDERLLAGHTDENRIFDLRQEALRHRHTIRHAPLHGFLGARIDLIPHQIYIAQEVASRLLPRVLLADEVGLGKTVEACLILHRLYRCGRTKRALILVPETLVHQWFVELLRRFNLRVSIYDEERCKSIESGDPEANPFLDEQIILCPISLISQNPRRSQQVIDAGWDLLIVDEAHHLEWSPQESSPEYQLVETLAEKTDGLILLTAVPEQLGIEAHFARLRLLDPDRYNDFSHFENERKDYQKAAELAAKLLEKKSLSPTDQKNIRELCTADSRRVEKQLTALKNKSPEAQRASEQLLQELLDQHGPGRVMFRNTRAFMKGFPKRKARIYKLAAAEDNLHCEQEQDQDESSEARSYHLKSDPRITWLVDFLHSKQDSKVLLICRTREKVLALDEILRGHINCKIALFHEDLTLLQRDRNAAWFAEENGAQILLCSEIGSEGRNFQFAHDLVLFDLPDNPDLLEQRIGRLDRIGQTQTILIHVPCPKNSHLETLARWYHEGLNAFEKSLEGSPAILKALGKRLQAALQKQPSKQTLDKLIADTQTLYASILRELEQGQDRLLQMNSFRPDSAKKWVEQIAARDKNTTLDDFILRLFDHYGIHVEELGNRSFLVVPANLTNEAFPELPEQGLTLSADRRYALSHEEIDFLTWDHPVVTGGIDLLLGSEHGNSAFAIWETEDGQNIYMETVFVVEAVAPPALHVDRFLPATPIRIVVDAAGNDLSESIHPPAEELKEGSVFQLLDNSKIKQKVLPRMLKKSQEYAKEKSSALAVLARKQMQANLGGELRRLHDLSQTTKHVRKEEITSLEQQIHSLEQSIIEAPVRLDSLRLIWKLPAA
ncbi:MAG: RNA polymerase-associated protein RapA [Chthoniobacterales bacterium]